MAKKGSGSSPFFTCAATTVVGTSAWIQSLASNDALAMTSPVAVTFAEDCSAHPSRKGRVDAGTGWEVGWAAAIASEKNGIKRRSIFIKVSLKKNVEKWKAGGPFSESRPHVHNTFINSFQWRISAPFTAAAQGPS